MKAIWMRFSQAGRLAVMAVMIVGLVGIVSEDAAALGRGGGGRGGGGRGRNFNVDRSGGFGGGSVRFNGGSGARPADRSFQGNVQNVQGNRQQLQQNRQNAANQYQ